MLDVLFTDSSPFRIVFVSKPVYTIIPIAHSVFFSLAPFNNSYFGPITFATLSRNIVAYSNSYKWGSGGGA